MKKAVLFVTLALGLSALSSALAADPAFPKAEAGKKVTLEVWSWVPGLDKTVASFQGVPRHQRQDRQPRRWPQHLHQAANGP